MKKVLCWLILFILLAQPVSAAQYVAPTAPEQVQDLVPVESTSFGRDLWRIVKETVSSLQPELASAVRICVALIVAVMAVSMVRSMPGSSAQVAQFVGTLVIAALLLQKTQTLIHLAAQTISELSEYGKLLLPVMASALIGQGGLTSGTALYVGTAAFDAVLTTAISVLLIPMVYVFLVLSVAGSATGQHAMGKLRGFVKWLSVWLLKIVLYVFTGYMSITGVVSGTADAATLKATKLTMSGMIPVVGGILSDASEAVLVGAGVMKSAAGVYGLLVLLALWIAPFLRIGVQYLLLKLTAAVCDVFGIKEMSSLISSFSEAMGLLLGMTGACCIMLLISTVCFMKGVG